MTNKSFFINASLIIAIFILLGMTLDIWVNPPHPQKVSSDNLNFDAKELSETTVARKQYNNGLSNMILQKNLFRKERREYVPPRAPAPAVKSNTRPQKQPSPPPKIVLKGTLLTSQTKIAFLEGSYPVRTGDKDFTDRPLQRRGYRLGESISNYRIHNIEDNLVRLKNKAGHEISFALKEQGKSKKIQRKGNLLIQNTKGENKKIEIKKTTSSTRARTKASSAPNNRRQTRKTPTQIKRPKNTRGNVKITRPQRSTIPSQHISGR